MNYFYWSLIIFVIFLVTARVYGEHILYDNHWYEYIIDKGIEPDPQNVFLLSLIPLLRWMVIVSLIMLICVDYYDIRDEME